METHRQASNRKLSEVRGRASVLEDLFSILRSGSNHAALGVLDQLRNGTDVDEILTETKDGIVAGSHATYMDGYSSGRESNATLLLNALATLEDDQSSMLMARLRLGESPDSIVDGAFMSSMRKPPSSISR